jgi:hypothetical protein
MNRTTNIESEISVAKQKSRGGQQERLIAELKQGLEAAEKDYQAAEERTDARTHRWYQSRALLNKTEKFFKQLDFVEVVEKNNLRLEPNFTVKAVIPTGKAKGVVQCRDIWASIAAEIRELENASLTVEEAIERAHSQLDQLAEVGRPSVENCFIKLSGTSWDANPITFASKSSGIIQDKSYVSTADSNAFITWLNLDALKAKIAEEIKECGKAKHCVSMKDRTTRLVDLNDQLFEIELAEAAATWASEGHEQMRPELSVEAVLGIKITASA